MNEKNAYNTLRLMFGSSKPSNGYSYYFKVLKNVSPSPLHYYILYLSITLRT